MQTIKALDPPALQKTARARRGAIVLAALAGAALLSACGSSSSSSSNSTSGSATPKAILNTRHVELAIKQSILSERHVHAKVFCPKVVPQEKGRNFTCIATTGKTKTPFAVTQTNTHGYVTYHAE